MLAEVFGARLASTASSRRSSIRMGILPLDDVQDLQRDFAAAAEMPGPRHGATGQEVRDPGPNRSFEFGSAKVSIGLHGGGIACRALSRAVSAAAMRFSMGRIAMSLCFGGLEGGQGLGHSGIFVAELFDRRRAKDLSSPARDPQFEFLVGEMPDVRVRIGDPRPSQPVVAGPCSLEFTFLECLDASLEVQDLDGLGEPLEKPHHLARLGRRHLAFGDAGHEAPSGLSNVFGRGNRGHGAIGDLQLQSVASTPANCPISLKKGIPVFPDVKQPLLS